VGSPRAVSIALTLAMTNGKLPLTDDLSKTGS
jgi:hypothetical protein